VASGEDPQLHPNSYDKGLVVDSVAKHHGISTKFEKPLQPIDTDLVIQ
jgi:hypothetical protein